jgi:type II secretory pathway component PulK
VHAVIRPSLPPRAERGIALLVVIMLGAILVPFAAEFAYQITLEAITADNVTDQLAIDNAIESQYQIVLARLRYDGQRNETDTYEDPWNDDQVRSRSDEDSGVRIETHVFDEQAKLNVRNLAQGSPERQEVWKARLIEVLKRFRQDTKWDVSSQAEEIANDVTRWLRGQANRGNIPSPKTIDDRPILVLEELVFVNEIFEREQLLVDRREGSEVAPGLHRYLTVHGNGKINLNTADKLVLQAIFARDPEIADRIIERREGSAAGEEEPPPDEEEGAEGPQGDPFTDPNQVNEVEGVTQPILVANKVIPAEDFDVRSNVFSMRIAAQSDASRRDELFIVERVPGSDPNGPIEGFRHLLCQERTDVLDSELDEEP